MMKKKIFIYGFVLTVLLFLLTGCTSSTNNTTTNNIVGDTLLPEKNDTEDEEIPEEIVINVEDDKTVFIYDNKTQNTVINDTSTIQNNVLEEQNNTEAKKEETKVKTNTNTTNDDETVKKGNSGKYAYINPGKMYDIYWIIDFNEGYVYDFTERNDDDSCEKIKIKSGDLNTGLKLSYKDSDNAWAQDIRFKAKNFPNQIVIVDNDGFEYTYSSTNINDALKLLEKKEIWEP